MAAVLLVHVAQVDVVGKKAMSRGPSVLTFPCQTYPSVSPVTGH